MGNGHLPDRFRRILDDIVKREVGELEQGIRRLESNVARDVETMAPVVKLLNELKADIGEVDGVKISPAAAGHMATVTGGNVTLRVFPGGNRSAFEVEERDTNSYLDEPFEKTHQFENEEQVMNLVLAVVGRQIARERVRENR